MIISKTAGGDIKHVHRVSATLHRACVTLKLTKCSLFTNTSNYAGHFVRLRRLATAPHAFDATKRLQRSRNITKLCSFLGHCSVLNRFVSNFACMAAPLSRKLQKDLLKRFGSLCKKDPSTMTTLPKKFISSPLSTLCYAGVLYVRHRCVQHTSSMRPTT